MMLYSMPIGSELRTVVPPMQDDEFRILQRSYDRQYAQLYFARLMVMSQRVREQATQRWPNVKGSQQIGRQDASTV